MRPVTSQTVGVDRQVANVKILHAHRKTVDITGGARKTEESAVMVTFSAGAGIGIKIVADLEPRYGSIEFGSDGTWEANGIKVDFDQRRVFVRGEEVHLRRKEFELLRLLVENSGRVLTRDVLIDRVWGTDYIGDTKTLDVHIKRLRSRIEADPSTPVLITTVRGVGYRFAAA